MDKSKASAIAKCLADAGEYLGAGLYEEYDAPMIKRIARGIRRQLENAELQAPKVGVLYPEGQSALWKTAHSIFTFHYSSSLGYNRDALISYSNSIEDSEAKDCLKAVDDEFKDYYRCGSSIEPAYRLGGDGYTHSIPNTGRILKEGLHSYAKRVKHKLQAAETDEDAETVALYAALEDILAGIAALHGRILAKLEDESHTNEKRFRPLITALKQVPFNPARSFYEAMVAANFIFYIDGCDSPGRFDQDLFEYYNRDEKAGLIDHEGAVSLVRAFFRNIDDNTGWNMAIGGSMRSGASAYNALTEICLEAAKGMRRPNLAFRIRRDMPDELWDAALDTIGTGCGLPALYNEEAYLKALREAHLNIHYEDIYDYAFGGCTETMIHGKSNVGSLDAGINLLAILADTLNSYFVQAKNFDELLKRYKDNLSAVIRKVTEQVSADQRLKAEYLPQPMRTLLIDDCIDAGLEYNAGGARYNWSVINIGGLGNAADSLTAVKELVFDKREIDAEALLKALKNDFAENEILEKKIEACPKYGNNQPSVDELVRDISDFVFEQFSRYAPWRGGRFLPGCLMFVTYADAGKNLMATPDGRKEGMPIADSAGPVQGRDRHGPTAMMNSVAYLRHNKAPGTLVVNLRLVKSLFDSPEGRCAVKNLIKTYFASGCMQIQINVVDQAVLRDAIAHPEKYEDLIVRVGGYSEYFNRLSPELKMSVLQRTEHNAG